MPWSRLAALVVVLIAPGCRSAADILRLDRTLRPQTVPDSIQLLAQEPTQPYSVIALVAARERGWPFPPVQVVLAREAARLGGDAVLLGTESLTRIGTGGEYGGSMVLVTGKVIVFKREARGPR